MSELYFGLLIISLGLNAYLLFRSLRTGPVSMSPRHCDQPPAEGD